MRYSAVSASIVMVRPTSPTPATIGRNPNLDYELLFLKRADSTYAGGCFAFPGGKVERQDYRETWHASLVNLPNELARFHDFNKRVAAIRETFEETNLLLATSAPGKPLPSLSTFESEHKQDFSGFCKRFCLTPQLDQLYAYRRIATPYGSPNVQDT